MTGAIFRIPTGLYNRSYLQLNDWSSKGLIDNRNALKSKPGQVWCNSYYIVLFNYLWEKSIYDYRWEIIPIIIKNGGYSKMAVVKGNQVGRSRNQIISAKAKYPKDKYKNLSLERLLEIQQTSYDRVY